MRSIDILPGLKAEDSRIRLYSYSEPLQILLADAAEMFAASPIHGLMQTTWYFSRETMCFPGAMQPAPYIPVLKRQGFMAQLDNILKSIHIFLS